MVDSVEYFFFSVLNRLAHHLPYRIAGRVGALLGEATFRYTSFRKEITMKNLSRAFPELDEHALRQIAIGAYQNYGVALLEMLWAGKQSAEELVDKVMIDKPEVMREALSEGKGVIFLSGHYGSWEFLVSALSLQFERRVAAVAQRQRNARIDALLDANRSRFGNTTIPMGPSARRIIDALQRGDIVLMLGDQSGPREALFVEFFNQPAATHRGAAAFSLKTGAPIVMGFLIRQGDGRYELVIERVSREAIDTYTEENVVELTRRHTAILERYIRLHPDHWLWMHKRWKHTGFYESHQPAEEKA